MTVLFVIIGGAAGGGLGWLLDRRAEKRRDTGAGTQANNDCQTST